MENCASDEIVNLVRSNAKTVEDFVGTGAEALLVIDRGAGRDMFHNLPPPVGRGKRCGR